MSFCPVKQKLIFSIYIINEGCYMSCSNMDLLSKQLAGYDLADKFDTPIQEADDNLEWSICAR